LEQKFKVGAPSLTDYSTTSDLLALINHRRNKKGLDEYSESKEIVRFDHRINGLSALFDHPGSEHRDPLGDLANKSGYSELTIEFATRGRLLPEFVCNRIAQTSGLRSLDVQYAQPGRSAAPVSDPSCLRNIFRVLTG
jgi:hypothetical protein